MGQVQAEYAGRARAGAAAAGRRDNFLWVDQSGREVTPPDMDVRPVVLVCDGTGPGHVPKPGERFCPECGRARP